MRSPPSELPTETSSTEVKAAGRWMTTAWVHDSDLSDESTISGTHGYPSLKNDGPEKQWLRHDSGARFVHAEGIAGLTHQQHHLISPLAKAGSQLEDIFSVLLAAIKAVELLAVG